MTLHLLKVLLQTFLSIPVTQKYLILSCDTLVASGLYIYIFFNNFFQCATSRKFAGSIPEGVTGIFHRLNPSGRTMSLESTQPPTQKCTRGISLMVKAAGA